MKLNGKCTCGTVTITIDAEPQFQGYCHCRSCQIAHSAPMVAAVGFFSDGVTVEGELREFRVTDREGAVKRFACAKCGAVMFNEPAPVFKTIFPSRFEPSDWFAPQMHLNWADHVVDTQDALPKFIDYPKEYGGSGEMAG